MKKKTLFIIYVQNCGFCRRLKKKKMVKGIRFKNSINILTNNKT